MPYDWLSPLSALCLAAAFSVSGCGSSEPQAEPSGSLTMNLELPGNVTIDEVTYAISGNGIAPIGGVIDTSGSGTAVSFSVSVLAGQGYLLELSAISTDNERSCRGSAPFDITAGQTTSILVGLSCRRTGDVQVNGDFNHCAEVTQPYASPQQTPIGDMIDLGVLGVDEENDPIEYVWTGSGGTFSTPTASTTTYTCDAVGTHTVSIVLSDDGFSKCTEGWTTTVVCDAVAPCSINNGDCGPAEAFLCSDDPIAGAVCSVRTDLAGADLRGLDLSGTDLSGANLSGTNLSGANLELAYLFGANLIDANLTGANLNLADLSQANLSGADLSGASLEFANLDIANLRNTWLSSTNFRGANLIAVDFTDAGLPNTSFVGAELSGANFTGGLLQSVDFTDTTLYLVNFSLADLRGVDLRGLNLGDASLQGADLEFANLSDANLSGANLHSANLTHADLQRANLDAAIFNFAGLANANLAFAYLYSASLTDADLAGADLNHANLESADLSGADLTGADLTDASYDTETLFPAGFDPVAAGMIFVGPP